ncbi:MAG: YcxB family protein, partial [Bacteroidota bacterium]
AGLVLQVPGIVLIGAGSGLALALYRLWWFRRFATHPENASFFEPRQYTFTDDMLEVSTFDGTEARQPLRSLIRAERGDEHWKLFISRGQFHYIPLSAFASEADAERLEAILRANGLA